MSAATMTPRVDLGKASAPVRGRRPASAVALRILVLAGGAAVALFWYEGSPAGTGPGPVLAGGGRLAGLLASYLVCVLLLLVSRAPWFERAVGLDRLVAWHRRLGTTVVLLVVAHALLAIVGGAIVDRVSVWAEVPLQLATQPELVEAWAGTALFVAAGLASARLIRRLLSYEVWLAVHLTLYVGIFLTFGHQLPHGSHFASSPAARALWIGLYCATAAALVTWRVVLPLWRLRTHVFRVEAVVPESPTATSVWVRGRDLDDLGARGGQFFLVRFLARGHLVSAHPYSVSALAGDGLLRFTVGALGDHSTAVRALRPGTRVLLEGPFGRFTSARARSPRVLLIAGGAGVGPIRALAEDFVREGRDVVVLHRARTDDDLALAGELRPVPELRYVPLVGRRSALGHDPLAPRWLRFLVPDVATREVFVCGPPGLVRTVLESCHTLRLSRDAVHHEELSLS
ncbi:ferric reductase-like transmembrane domain-containing protein [Antribacter gilvus]|uniref:ferredoxin reductase family protein n=1 Tax=Antribacter gilvus TaxID=2304675 RepID=UPI000F776D60|nr:ferredoxin reductase family protein [Antribacter gilvus]